ncbi:MAG: sugar ABC transporter substrate-binding protein [bacterium]|nr:sugar ABC transporter substrate-binding protein [bacterium]
MRRNMIVLMLLLISTVLLSGCGSQNKNEITVMWWGDVYNYKFARKLVDTYNAGNPDKPARLLAIQGQYETKLLTMSASRILPDVVLMMASNVHNLGVKGALLPLDQYVARERFKAVKQAMWPGLMNTFKVKDKQLAVPIWTWTPGIYYNKDIFDAAGVEYPSKNWTFREFEEKSCKLVKTENGKRKVYAFASPFALRDQLLTAYLYANDGRFYSDDYRKCEINSPSSVAALKAFSDLRLKYHAAPKASEASSMGTSGGTTDYFQAGHVAMTVRGRDYLDVLKQSGGIKFRWGVAPMPMGNKAAFFHTPVGLAISANTKHPEAAWNFVTFVTGKKGQDLISQDRSDVTIYKKLTYEKKFIDYQGRPDANIVFRDMLLEAVPSPYRIGDDEWKAKANNHLSLVELGRITIEQACAGIAGDFRP